MITQEQAVLCLSIHDNIFICVTSAVVGRIDLEYAMKCTKGYPNIKSLKSYIAPIKRRKNVRLIDRFHEEAKVITWEEFKSNYDNIKKSEDEKSH